MKTNKRIDLGEYIIIIEYNDMDGSLDVTILDELEDIIDVLSISNDEDTDDFDDGINLNPSLN